MDDSSKPKHEEAREFWEAAIRLWSESGLSVREFCRREDLTEAQRQAFAIADNLHFWRSGCECDQDFDECL